MRASVALIAILCVTSCMSGGEGADGEAVMIEQAITAANEIADAMHTADATLVVDRMHPRVLELSGGRDVALETTTRALEMMKSQGMAVTEYIVSPPDGLYQATDEVVMFLPTQMALESPAVIVRSTGYLIASRPHQGERWVFMDGSGVVDATVLPEIYPGLPPDVTLPEKTQQMEQK